MNLKPLYCLCGEDLLRIEYLDELRNLAKEQDISVREVFIMEAKSDWSAVEMSINSQGLFSDKKLIEIHIPTGKPGKGGADYLVRLPEMCNDDTTIIVVLPKLEYKDKKVKWFETLQKNSEFHEFEIPANLEHWIKTRLEQNGLFIDDDALFLFSEKMEGNLVVAAQEIKKLAAQCKKGTTLHADDIQTVIMNASQFDIFQLSSAWMSVKLARVRKIIDFLKIDNKNFPLLLIIISEDIRTLLRLRKAIKDEGKSLQSMVRPLRLFYGKDKLASQAINRIPPMVLIESLQMCAVADRQFKGAEPNSNINDAWDTVSQLLFRLTNASIHMQRI